MRRPNLCNNSVTVADDSYKPTPPNKEEDVRRLSLMRRMLGGNSSKRKELSGRVFGVPLAELKLTSSSVPVILHNICLFIEMHGLNVEGLWRGGCNSSVDELKCRLNKDATAEIESSCDVTAVALLLLVWLGELPQPLLPQKATSDLITIMKKYPDENCWFSDSLLSLGIIRHNSLDTLLHLLHSYTAIHPGSLNYVPSVFAPLITPAYFSASTLELVTRLILGYSGIFRHRSLKMEIIPDHEMDELNKNVKPRISETLEQNNKQRKRKERQDSTSMDSDRKFVRSNSEERPRGITNESNVCGDNNESIRRVSSHEDFSKSRSKTDQVVRKAAQPLQERNSCSPSRQRDNTLQLTSTVGYASDLYDESEHERRRNSERFAPQVRRRRTKHFRTSSQAKENESSGGHKIKSSSRQHLKSKSVIYDSIPSTPPEIVNTPFKQEDLEVEEEEEEERSPSPISGVSSPTLDMKVLHNPSDEPVTAWNTMLPPSEERMVSPRNSIVMTKRTFTSVQRDDDPTYLDLTMQINNLKQKLKKYEDGFEKEFGFRPSHADKMANPDTKRMCATLSKLRKQLKSTKEECSKITGFDKHRPVIKEEVVAEIEKRLAEKRAAAGRTENIDEMYPEEVIEEKCAMQKALLGLEATYGRPHSKEERELVRSLYERYRALKRALLRHAPSKVKESVSELGIIHEHETMEFTPPQPRAFSPAAIPQPRPSSPAPMPIDDQPPNEDRAESLLADLHALPPDELVELARTTREEKKRLRRSLREYEQDFEAKTGRKPHKQDRHPLDSLYTDYKNAKAKLRFIDALVTKIK